METESYYLNLIAYFTERIELSKQDIETIKSAYQLRVLRKKEFLFQQGEVCRYEAFVIQGACKLFYSDSKGSDHILYFAFKDWWVGDVASFSSNEPAAMSAQALEETYLLTINPEKKEELYLRVPQLERMFRIITQRTLSVLQKRFFLTMSGGAKDRYLQLIDRYPKIEQLVPQYQIASYLGILPESLSRLKKQLYEHTA
jgi:CRP/FNR family cyclic AMP-dependent transcriptional regulator